MLVRTKESKRGKGKGMRRKNEDVGEDGFLSRGQVIMQASRLRRC